MAEQGESHRVREAAAHAAARARELADKTSTAAPSFLRYLLQRFLADSCTQVAASLSYTSLLAVVPMLAIGLAMFAAFPGFAGLREDLIRLMLENFAPAQAATVQQYLDTFVRNAAETTGAGIIGLAVTAILLIHTIEVAFSRIWGSAGGGTRWSRFPVYWALLTLGPILFGVSISISTYVFGLANSANFYGLSTGIALLGTALPFLLEAAGFALVYRLMPTRPVRIPDAIWGGITAAFLFEVLKRLFALYLTLVPSYQALYGALATIPIFLLWMYLAWVVTLLGAEVAAALPEWRAGRRSVSAHLRRGDQVSLALAILAMLDEARAGGVGIRSRKMQQALGTDPIRLEAILERLKSAHVVAYSDGRRWVLTRDLAGLSLHDLSRILDLHLSRPDAGLSRVAPLVERLAAAESQILSQSVAEALASATAEPVPAEENRSGEHVRDTREVANSR